MARTALLASAVVLLLVTATSAAPAAPAAEPNYPGDDAAILTLDTSATAGFTTQSLDIGTAIATGHEEASAHLNRYARDEAYKAAASDEARRRVLREATGALEVAVASLMADERALRTEYANGSITSGEFVRGLIQNTARARQFQTEIDRIETRSIEVGQVTLRGQLETLSTTLVAFDGPVRTRAAAALRGDSSPVRVYVDVSRNGVVLAAITDTGYVREAYRADLRGRAAAPTFGLDQAVDRAGELYPVAFNNSLRTGVGFLPGGVYLITVELSDGSINAYLDAETGDIFYEIQERRPDRLSDKPAVSTAANGTRLTVNRMYRGGPLRIATLDNATGTPISTSVVVDGERFTTGSDGTFWTVVPPEPWFTVTAVGTTGNVSLIVEPMEPRSVTD